MSSIDRNARYVYNETEAANFLRCRVRTLRYWRSTDIGPRYVKAGRRVLYRHRDIVDFIDQGLTQTATTRPVRGGERDR